MTTDNSGMPPLPAYGMQETNPYLDMPAMDPYKGERVLVWFSPEQMLAYGRQVAQMCAETCETADCFVDDWRGMKRAAEAIRERFNLEKP